MKYKIYRYRNFEGRYIFIAKDGVLTLCEVKVYGILNPKIKYFKNNVYHIEKERLVSWDKANKLCRTLWKGKGRLVNIESYAENNFIKKQFNNGRSNVWLGGE